MCDLCEKDKSDVEFEEETNLLDNSNLHDSSNLNDSSNYLTTDITMPCPTEGEYFDIFNTCNKYS